MRDVQSVTPCAAKKVDADALLRASRVRRPRTSRASYARRVLTPCGAKCRAPRASSLSRA
eukprot:5946247-Pleurochrysis_carterae.AAC.3